MRGRDVVIGIGFGDEGKGLTTNYLCSQINPENKKLVVRFSGGHQAGHTVIHENKKHIFSSFGSGTLQGVPTYLTEKVVIDPISIINELKVLQEKKVENIKLYINRSSFVSTPYDKYMNTNSKENLKNGTCGVGIGTTIQREEDHYHLHFEDLFNRVVLDIKLNLIEKYYKSKNIPKLVLTDFLNSIQYIKDHPEIFECVSDIPHSDNYIFEGSQGLLLDQEYGFFPHVTRSNTGFKNLKDLIKYGSKYRVYLKPAQFYYVTRAYQTRHGNGPITNSEYELKLKNTEEETNVKNNYQGEFKKSVLDLNLLLYSLNKDIEEHNDVIIKNLVITCIDQLEEFTYTIDSVLYKEKNKEDFVTSIIDYFSDHKVFFENVYINESPKSNLNKFI